MIKLKYLGVALALVIGAQVAAQDSAQDEGCSDTSLCPIPYVRLSTQEERPFLYRGKVIDESHPRFGQFSKSLRRFPNVHACLKADESSEAAPDLSQLDWDLLKSPPDRQVCLFRIADSIETIAGIEAWFISNGFVPRDIFRPRTYEEPGEFVPSYSLSAAWTIDQYREHVPANLIMRLTGFETITSAGASVTFSSTGRVVSAYINTNSILN